MKLGDFLSDGDKRKYLRQCIVPGSIILLDCPFTIPPKPKFCILLCLEPEPVLALVNSKLSKWLEDRPHLRDRQVVLHQKHHDFLRYDSYIDCTKAQRKFSYTEIEGQVLKDSGKLKGVITPEEKSAILYAISTAKTIEAQVKEWVLEALH